MKAFIVVFMLVAGAFAACDKDPEGTNEKLYYKACEAGDQLVVNTVQLLQEDGSLDYPINVLAKIKLVLNLTNTASHALDQVKVSASIARYTDVFGICSWIGIPTFGLTDNLDACTFGAENICPVPPGVKVAETLIDLSAFKAIIDILSASEPYRLGLTFTANGKDDKICCETVEAKIRKG